MTPSRPSHSDSDERWVHGMNGWRCKVIYRRQGAILGEVTGYTPGMDCLSVVFDGEEYPVLCHWTEVRPA